MGKLKVLPAQVANMIAAGEVVQRPASVVKELMENAVDAGATQISVIVIDAGRTLIQVIDNGSGMSITDANLCFERHATSKIATAQDLSSIVTYGFRGEALASIAAVAEVTLKTRRPQDETGVEVTVLGNGEMKSRSAASPSGSNFAVRNLFYNTPARRKFLKSDNVELKHIIEEFIRVAITRPDIGFSLNCNGKDIFVLKKTKSDKFRIADVLGNGIVENIVDIAIDTSVVRIRGFIGKPESAKKTQGNQFFFANGRFFRSAYLHKAVVKAYEEMIPEGVTPPYFIHLDIDPTSIDVNIHPTKSEIKFEDDSVIFQTLYAGVKETLGRNSFGASIDFDTAGSVEIPQFGQGFEQYRGTVPPPSAKLNPDYDPFKSYEDPIKPDYDFSKHVDKKEDYGKLFEERVLPSSRLLTVQDKYILTPVSSGLMIVNIRRAWERILYDRIIKALGENGHITQATLFPVQVTVGTENRLLFDDNTDLLQSLGFDISPFGNDCVVVNGVPEGYSCESGKVQRLVEDLVYILSEGTDSLSEVMKQRLADKFSTLGATNAEKLGSPQEAQKLLDTLFASSNAELTSNGRRIVSIVSMEDIEKRF